MHRQDPRGHLAAKTQRIWKFDFAEYGDTIDRNPHATIIPARPISLDSAGRDAVGLLRQLSTDSALGKLELADTIGTGGVGIVFQARQVALGRDVAVKMLREDKRNEAAITDLLREAWVAGSLEHPNVVPVYDILLGDNADPLIVLKRIEGMAWSELIRDGDRVRDQFAADSLLEWNLGILMQVLNAVRYAHSRGIVHRDLKPANVMVGEFGEVYVVDWGLAVSLHDDRSGRLPLAHRATAMAGTPCYMAPEMLGDGASPITERTDIYLIGAVLYEILSGRPPHLGENAMALVRSVVMSDPDFPVDAPDGLVRICRRAMDPDPDGRFENAEQVRLAIQGFLQHRGSEQLAERAEAMRAELSAELAKRVGPSSEHRQRLYKLFGACRFGFREALATWSGNRAARDGLDRATEAMIEYELTQGDPRAAAALCAELPEPPHSLQARIDAERARQAAEKQRSAELEQLGRQLDMSVGQRSRTLAILVLGVTFTVVPALFMWQLGDRMFASHPQIMSWNAVFLVLSLIVGYGIRASLRESAVNRRLYTLLLLILVVQLPMQFGLWAGGFTPSQSILVHMFVWFFLAAIIAATFDVRLVPATLAYLAAFLTMAVVPDIALYIMSVPHGVLTLNAVLIWRPS
ncbi:MAG: protein kinase [Proteobacteria bacterium]|nr:protein kinase [Pseudomonadota bacterium]